MPQPIKNSTPAVPHLIVTPGPGQDYHAVVHADSGREVVRAANITEALKEQARLNKL